MILITIDETKARKSSCGLESWWTIWVANELRDIVVDDRGGNNICSTRKVDQGLGDSCRLANTWGTSISTADSGLDGSSIISHSIAATDVRLLSENMRSTLPLGAKIFDVAENLVPSIGIESCNALMLDILQPIRSASRS